MALTVKNEDLTLVDDCDVFEFPLLLNKNSYAVMYNCIKVDHGSRNC